jgi:hypothetical protein
MSQSSTARRLFAALMSLLLWLPLAATADDDHDEETEGLPFSELTFPEPERHFSATSECVEPEAEMRRNHMNYILHQRDETMHAGIRTRQYSLEECVNCHASKDESGEYLPINGPDQFCSSCHAYTAVHIDCFQCHATKPERPSMLHQSSTGAASHARPMSGETLQALASEGQAK